MQQFAAAEQGPRQLLAQQAQLVSPGPLQLNIALAQLPQAQQASASGQGHEAIHADPAREHALHGKPALLPGRHSGFQGEHLIGGQQFAHRRCRGARLPAAAAQAGVDAAEGLIHRRVVAGALDAAEVQQPAPFRPGAAAAADRRAGPQHGVLGGWAIEAEGLIALAGFAAGRQLLEMALEAAAQVRREARSDRRALGQQGALLRIHQQQALAVLNDRRLLELAAREAGIFASGVGIKRIPVPPIEHGDLVAVHPQLEQALIGLPLAGLALLQQLPALLG